MANWRKELRELTRRFPSDAETDLTRDAMYDTESDRGAALIAGSVAENALESIILTYLIPLSKTNQQELFGIDGVLASFSAKIKVAFAFGLIDAELRDRFDRIREIRNAFAHSKVVINFDTPPVRRGCMELLSEKTNSSAANPRQIYTFMAYTFISAGMLVMQRSLRRKRKLSHEPISYGAVQTFHGKLMRRFLRQPQKNSSRGE